MKKKLYSILVLILIVIAAFLRLTHTINSNTFALFGLIIAILGFIRSVNSHNSKMEGQRITDIEENFNPVKKRYNFVFGMVKFLVAFYLVIFIINILSSF